MIKSFLNLPFWVRYALYFSLGCPYAYFGPNMDLASRVLPAVTLAVLLPLSFYPELLRLLARHSRSPNDDNLVEIICNHSLDLMPGDCSILLDHHDALMAMKRYEEAKTYSDWAVRIAPKLWGTWYRSAVVAMWLNDYESAAINVEKALELAPSNSYGLVVRAAVRESNGDLQGCLEDCARIDPKGKGAAQMRMLSSRVHIRSANFQAAKDIMGKLPKRIKAGSDDAVTLAYFRFCQNQFSEVLTICAQEPDDHSAAYWFLDIQASSYRRLNEGALALKSISRSIAMRPERTDGYEEKALVLADAGLLNQALVGCKRTEVLGKKKTSRTAEAYVRFRRGEFEEMLECTQVAITFLPKSAYVRALHSLALAGLERVDEAMEEAIKATELHSLEALGWYALADAHLKQDQLEQAI
ncbi:hypothetical protein KBI23_18940, partial [bacterium]|nr:hypothetical protein [bacterium]